MEQKPNIAIIASREARTSPSGALVRFVRDHATLLNQFALHATKGTADSVERTGVIVPSIIVRHRSGSQGGVAEIAAMAARGACQAVILLLEPSDLRSDVPEMRALKRVCIQRSIRLITTAAGAERWASFETHPVVVEQTRAPVPQPMTTGHSNMDGNSPKRLVPAEQSIALIAHDRKKREMLEFVTPRLDLLANFDRILATGTTGWLLKLVTTEDPGQLAKLIEAMVASGTSAARMRNVVAELITSFGGDERAPGNQALELLLAELRKVSRIAPNPNFATRVYPVASGPKGGDVLIAEEVLDHKCHTIIFFHDPETAHPHDADIRLLERTCQIPGVYAVCVSEAISAVKWAATVEQELRGEQRENLAQKLRERFAQNGLREAILVEEYDAESDDVIGRRLAHACAGYFHQRLVYESRKSGSLRIGIAWGQMMNNVLEEVKDIFGEAPAQLQASVVFSPLIGFVSARDERWEASEIARRFAEHYCGEAEFFGCAGYRASGDLPADERRKMGYLKSADLILTGAGPYSKEAITKLTRLNPDSLPEDHTAAGMICSVLIKPNGKSADFGYTIVGLDYDTLRESAQRGVVVLLCGGKNRQPVARAALEGGLVSVLVTTTKTARHLLT